MSEDSYPVCPWCYKRLREVQGEDPWGGFKYCPVHGSIPKRMIQHYQTWADNKTLPTKVLA